MKRMLFAISYAVSLGILISALSTPATAGMKVVEQYPKLFKIPPKNPEGMSMLKSYCAKMGFKKGTEKNGEYVLKLFTDPMIGMKHGLSGETSMLDFTPRS